MIAPVASPTKILTADSRVVIVLTREVNRIP